MSAPIAKSQFAFELPNLSYVDASLEEPNRFVVEQAHPVQGGLGGWLASRYAAFVAWREELRALSELEMMSDHELADIGLSRSDLPRVFDPECNQDLQARGSY